MQRRRLGTSELLIAPIGLGCMGMSEFYGPADEGECIRTLHAAIDLGVNFFDTADMYGCGHNETLLARAFADRWDRVVLATKFGVVRTEDGGFGGICGRPEYVRSTCERSLARLGREAIDLYYAHRIDPDVPVEETVGAMRDLALEGKVRCLGLSEASADDIRRAHRVHPIAALQSEYSLWTRDPEGEILDACRDLRIGIVPYSPLGRGFLAGAIPARNTLGAGDGRLRMPRFEDDALQRNRVYLDLINDFAAQKSVTPAQIALAWVLHQGDDMFPIPGTRNVVRLCENIEALDVSFTADELALIRSRLPVTIGARYG